VTAVLVVDGAEKISIQLTDRRSFEAKLIGSDAPSDLWDARPSRAPWGTRIRCVSVTFVSQWATCSVSARPSPRESSAQEPVLPASAMGVWGQTSQFLSRTRQSARWLCAENWRAACQKYLEL